MADKTGTITKTRCMICALALTYLGAGFLFAFAARRQGVETAMIFARKIARAQNEEHRPRILIAGGSNAIWGFRSNILEKKFKVPTTNISILGEGGDPVVFRELVARQAETGDVVIYSSISLWGMSGIDQHEARTVMTSLGAQYVPKDDSVLQKKYGTNLVGKTQDWYWRPLPFGESLAMGLSRIFYRNFIKNSGAGFWGDYNAYGDLTKCRPQAVTPIAFTAPPKTEALVKELKLFENQVRARGARLVIAKPWLLVKESERSRWVESYQEPYATLAREFTTTSEKPEDNFLTTPDAFCDRAQHIDDTAAALHSERLAKDLEPFVAPGEAHQASAD